MGISSAGGFNRPCARPSFLAPAALRLGPQTAARRDRELPLAELMIDRGVLVRAFVQRLARIAYVV